MVNGDLSGPMELHTNDGGTQSCGVGATVFSVSPDGVELEVQGAHTTQYETVLEC